MRKIVRLILAHYDRFGIIAAVGWMFCLFGIVGIPLLTIEKLLVLVTALSGNNPSAIAVLIVSPIMFYLSPPLWASGMLIVERMWMLFGIYRLFGWEPFGLRKRIGQLAHENEQDNEEK